MRSKQRLRFILAGWARPWESSNGDLYEIRSYPGLITGYGYTIDDARSMVWSRIDKEVGRVGMVSWYEKVWAQLTEKDFKDALYYWNKVFTNQLEIILATRSDGPEEDTGIGIEECVVIVDPREG